MMKMLKKLQTKHKLSMLILAHTPKRDMSRPITQNDAAGSKMILNFADSAFAIGESAKEENLKYIKQIKQRNTERIYGSTKVILCNIVKDYNFLCFNFKGYGVETEHLKQLDNKEKEDINEKVLQLHRERLSSRKIGEQVGLSHMQVSRIIKKYTGASPETEATEEE